MNFREELRKIMPPQMQSMIPDTEMSYEELNRQIAKRLNSEPGKLTGFDCPKCLNRGYSYVLRGSELETVDCSCKKARHTLWNMKKSGLGDLLEQCTFQNYRTDEDWQKKLKWAAVRYSQQPDGWFYIGGQVGAGKTHLCTAILSVLIQSGAEGKYMLWRDEIVRLKASVNDDAVYEELIRPLKDVDVLYIDDFFKTSKDDFGKKRPPTGSDIQVAFEILNSRYNDRNKVTILSGERTMDELLSCDEAVGSRIYQRTKGNCWIIPADIHKNYRLKEQEEQP